MSQPSVWLLLFPIFFIAGFAGLAARLLQRPLNALRARADSLSSAPYLAVHRLAGARRLAILLVTACALALGTFVYAQTVVSSLEKTVVAKSLLFVGSDVHGVINYHQETPRGFPYPVTKTTKVVRGGDLDGQQVDFLAIDTGSFADAAYWDRSWSSRSVDELMRELRSASGQTLPVFIAGKGAVPSDELELGDARIPIRVVETTSAAPAMALARPMVVADAALVERLADRAGVSNPLAATGNDTELWAKGPTAAVASAFATSDTHPFPIVTAEEVRDNPSITAVTRTFGFLKSLGFGAGLLAVVGLVLYLQARQRSRIVVLCTLAADGPCEWEPSPLSRTRARHHAARCARDRCSARDRSCPARAGRCRSAREHPAGSPLQRAPRADLRRGGGPGRHRAPRRPPG